MARKQTQGRARRSHLPETVIFHTVKIEHTMRSRESHTLFHRNLDMLNSALLWIETVIDRVPDERVNLKQLDKRLSGMMLLNQVEAMIEERMRDLSAKIDAEIERLVALREQHKVRLAVATHNGVTETVELSSPIAMQWLNLLGQIDDLSEEVFALNFSGLLDRNSRKFTIVEYTDEVRNLARLCLNLNRYVNDKVKEVKASERTAQANNQAQTSKAQSGDAANKQPAKAEAKPKPEQKKPAPKARRARKPTASTTPSQSDIAKANAA